MTQGSEVHNQARGNSISQHIQMGIYNGDIQMGTYKWGQFSCVCRSFANFSFPVLFDCLSPQTQPTSFSLQVAAFGLIAEEKASSGCFDLSFWISLLPVLTTWWLHKKLIK